jgi:hypothetical protein
MQLFVARVRLEHSCRLTKKQTPWFLVRKLSIPAERHHLSAKFVPNFADRGVSRGEHNWSARPLISIFWHEPLLHHSSSSSVIPTMLIGPVPDPLLLEKCGSAGNRARDLLIYSHKLWPLGLRMTKLRKALQMTPSGTAFEYFRCSPENYRRRRKGTPPPLPWDMVWRPCNGACKYRDPCPRD